MRRAASLLAFSVVAVGAWLTPAVAEACSCFTDEVLLWPQDGSLAEDEALLLQIQGCGTSLGSGDAQEHVAFVDGNRVELASVDGRPGYTIEPMPEVGTTVTIARCGYELECELDMVEPDNRFDITIVDAASGGEPADPAVTELDYELAELDDCGFGTIKARDWTFELTPDSGEPRVHEITLGSEDDLRPAYRFTESSEPVEYVFRRTEEDAGKTVCATVRSYDMAGNQSSEVSTCYELGRRETLDRAGCSCAADPNPTQNLVLTLLALTALLRTRRS